MAGAGVSTTADIGRQARRGLFPSVAAKNVPANPAKFAAVPAPRPVNQRFPLMQTYIPPIDLEPMNARFSKLLTGRSCFALAALFWLATPVVSDAATLWLASKGPTSATGGAPASWSTNHVVSCASRD